MKPSPLGPSPVLCVLHRLGVLPSGASRARSGVDLLRNPAGLGQGWGDSSGNSGRSRAPGWSAVSGPAVGSIAAGRVTASCGVPDRPGQAVQRWWSSIVTFRNLE
jgi:hypothetical protein